MGEYYDTRSLGYSTYDANLAKFARCRLYLIEDCMLGLGHGRLQ